VASVRETLLNARPGHGAPSAVIAFRPVWERSGQRTKVLQPARKRHSERIRSGLLLVVLSASEVGAAHEFCIALRKQGRDERRRRLPRPFQTRSLEGAEWAVRHCC
jgi:hypothetical protein